MARYLIVCLPAALLLIAYGLTEIRYPWIRYALVMLMLLSALAPLRSYYAEPGRKIGGVLSAMSRERLVLVISQLCRMDTAKCLSITTSSTWTRFRAFPQFCRPPRTRYKGKRRQPPDMSG